LAKGLGGGVPIGAILATEEAAGLIEYGKHGTTFGGNPLSCNAALATIDVIMEENLLRQAEENGKWFRKRIEKEIDKEPGIDEVRGMGLMLGVQLTFEGAGVAIAMLEQGVIVNCTAGSVIRVVPPLNITREELETVADVLLKCIKSERQRFEKGKAE